MTTSHDDTQRRGPHGSAITEDDVLRGLRDLGVEPGASLLVHSSLSSLGHVDGGAPAVIRALERAIGPAGLVAMPTHTWATVNARQPVFHETLSPSTVGLVTEVFRREVAQARSLHPTHSVAASGRGAAAFTAGHHEHDTPCAPDSPYGRLVERGGFVLLVGVGLERCTLIHGFEEWAGIPWLFNRTEDLWSITRDNRAIAVPSRRHTDDPRYQARDFTRLEPLLRDHGAIRFGTIGAAPVRVVDAARARDCVVAAFTADPNLLVAPTPR